MHLATLTSRAIDISFFCRKIAPAKQCIDKAAVFLALSSSLIPSLLVSSLQEAHHGGSRSSAHSARRGGDVVGGGIAGMQASLDLAESGFKVYLVESKSAIGGHMAQLDKTFPPTLRDVQHQPQLVEWAGTSTSKSCRHRIVQVDGEAGNFTATVRHKPRYIDVLKCTRLRRVCTVCPVVIRPASRREC